MSKAMSDVTTRGLRGRARTPSAYVSRAVSAPASKRSSVVLCPSVETISIIVSIVHSNVPQFLHLDSMHPGHAQGPRFLTE